MFCSYCGTQLVPNARFCSKCGVPISKKPSTVDQFSVSKQQVAIPAQVRDPTTLGTKWLKFWNYFALPFGGVVGLLMTVSSPVLGIIMIPFAILQFVVVYGLHQRKLWAWQMNWALVVITYIYIISIAITTLQSHGGTADLVVHFLIGLILGGLIWMCPNYVYWKKRKGLFSYENILPRPPVTKEKEFIEWMLRNDSKLSIFRNMIPKKSLDSVIKSTVDEIMRELIDNPSGEKLMDKLGTIGDFYQNTLKPIIKKRGGIEYCPENIQILYLACITKMVILPYFVQNKYGMNLSRDIFPLKEL